MMNIHTPWQKILLIFLAITIASILLSRYLIPLVVAPLAFVVYALRLTLLVGIVALVIWALRRR